MIATNLRWLVPKSQKLIPFIQAQIDPPPSRKALRRVLEARLCRVNGVVERFGSMDVQKGAVVELSPNWASILSPHCSRFEVLYEDENLFIVDKPAGFVCSDVECAKAFGAQKYLVHRLDKETTGVLVIAKTIAAKTSLMHQFKERSVEKFYYALVDGAPVQERGVCKSFFAKVGIFQGQTKWGSRAKGLPAETHWAVLWRGKNTSLLLCKPVTGRTHQIRVHLAEMGHPILGDRQYAKNYRCQLFVQRPLLHAARIRVGEVDTSAPIPDDFASALKEIGCRTLSS